MNTSIFYYTGTGNSLWVARQAAEALGDADVRSMSAWLQARPAIDSTSIGLVFPVYIWGVPAPVMRFVAALPDLRDRYFFAVATNGGHIAPGGLQVADVQVRGDEGHGPVEGGGECQGTGHVPQGRQHTPIDDLAPGVAGAIIGANPQQSPARPHFQDF